MADKIAGIDESYRPRVLYLQRFLSGLKVGGKDTYMDFAIDLAGGANPAAELSGWTAVNVEQVIAWDPEVILLNNFEDGRTPQDVYDRPEERRGGNEC